MNLKPPQGMLKAPQCSYGTQASPLSCLRALFQLFLMYSGAQTARLTWPKWNQSILSTLPKDQQQQMLPAKSRLLVLQAVLDLWNCRKCTLYSAAIMVLFPLVIAPWSGAFIPQLTVQFQLTQQLSVAGGRLLYEPRCSHGLHHAAGHTQPSACCYYLDRGLSREWWCTVD